MHKLKNEGFIFDLESYAKHTLCWLSLTIICIPTMVNANDINAPDRAGNVGKFTSLALNAKGNPVVVYHDLTHRNLKLLRCEDPNCEGDQSGNISVVDAAGMVGTYNSLALDAAGNPVVSYFDSTKGVLKLLHCSSPDCLSRSTNIADSASIVGMYTSLALDHAGNPVVSYYDSTNGDLKLLHCNNPDCSGDQSKNISTPDSTGDVGLYTSLALDSTGNPVISYFASKIGLRLLHCDDPDCKGNESVNTSTPDTGDVGWYSSLVLDTVGNPVIGYYNFTSGKLKILHCGDPKCVGDQSKNITIADTAAQTGGELSMSLDDRGNPVISYYDATNGDLKILHCDDPRCMGDESGNTTMVDTKGEVGLYTSLVLDSSGNPAVSYYDFSNGDLKLLHCSNLGCKSN